MHAQCGRSRLFSGAHTPQPKGLNRPGFANLKKQADPGFFGSRFFNVGTNLA